THAQRLLKAAQELQGLDPSLVTAVQVLERDFLNELSVLNEQLLQAVRAHEPEQIKEADLRRVSIDGGQTREHAADPLQSQFLKRMEREQFVLEQLQAM